MKYKLIAGGVYFPEEETLAIADLHIGYDAELRAKGIYIPSEEFPLLFERCKKMLAVTKPKRIIINGDFKHAFGRISDTEWRHAGRLLALLGEHAEIILIAGNHDPFIGPLAKKHDLHVHSFYQLNDVLFTHGDHLPKGEEEVAAKNSNLIVIGHEHPAIGIQKNARVEIVKCYLRGTWKKKDLLVLPSLFSLTPGTNVLDHNLHSPFLDDVSSFEVFALTEEGIMPFGTVKDVEKLQ